MKKSVVLIVFLIVLSACTKEPVNTKISGGVFGTFYEVTYHSEGNEKYNTQFDSLFAVINRSMSNYQPDSDISKLNRHEIDVVDDHFVNVFVGAKQIFKDTKGVFDPTIGILVNAWNFGSEKNLKPLDSVKVDSLMQYVGFNRLLLSGNTIRESYPRPYIDFNAIAKGYAVDVIGDFLVSKNIQNFMVNIGGELVTRGSNVESKKGWTVGIENPNYDGSQTFDKVFVLKDEAMATSGTYRKFKTDENGNKYAHIINTKTGYPTKTKILSASVITKNCMLADGYATALQAMGVEGVKQFMARHKELKGYIIFENENKEYESLGFNNFPE
ncbi:FAD:protein FMN transferase [Bizionia gelidisalsuginis]|uniref:FAD:protein FMN transferase n=1 Tax=Bizionia gelidisalsuginis TaxID=291188 RepID=A0ABY3MA81_9FLAO|nr:FAD:protein FMN transferase [Bizionia gelidisalsuginis]TYC12663.1 FAD:protein FMN transferase [Bizionia gelidisalsuginis]